MIPKIDEIIGIHKYSTATKGTGGRIRSSKDQFFVSEVLRKKTFDKISKSGPYCVYSLKKTGIDTNHALSEIFEKYGIRLKALGLKDANATTEQFVCDMNTHQNAKNIETNRYNLEKIGFVEKPLTKKDMIGNHFKIKIENANFSEISCFDPVNKILNFYGYQRFGSRRPVSHIIGKSIIHGDFENAISTLLSSTSEFDSPENNKIREQLSDRNSYAKILPTLPPQMDIERMVLREMIESNNPARAIHMMPISLRRLFVEAYQSFIFNQTLSMAFEKGEDLFVPTAGDVCFDRNGNLGRYENDPEQSLAVPIVGYAYMRKNRFDYEISKVLENEGTSPKNFFVKEMQELSSEGGFRQSAIQCDDFKTEDPYVKFTLSRGSYATIVLREIIKPKDPIAAGF